ncbi:MAG: hypothetical protein M1833_006579 [Piccolia ochrophora]|nr:MAG: hypothetical protein M1833_006579 [Piccolia ochrophora]
MTENEKQNGGWGEERSARVDASTSPDSNKDVSSTASTDHQLTDPVAEKAVAPGPPPDGGTKAWLQVVGGFLLVLNTWGLVNSFGIFQTHYSTELLPASTPSAISWIGSIQAFLLLFAGILCGRALDAGYFFHVAFVGGFLEVFGMMMTSISTKYWQVFLSQGLCVGLGCGCLFTPSIAIIGTYFSTKRSLATGIAASGSSVGGVIYPILIKQMIQSIGFAWAVRTMAFVMFITIAIALSLLRPRLPPRKSGPLIIWAAIKEPAYSSFIFGLMLAFLAFFIPFFYAQTYALNIGMDQNLAFYVLSIMNAAGMVGRLLPNALADKAGNLNVIIPCAFLSAVTAFAWIAAKSSASMIVVSILYSFFSGGLMALPPAVIVTLSPSMNEVGTRIGMAFFVGSLGVLIGSPIAGAILDAQSPRDSSMHLVVGEEVFWGVLLFTGIMLVASGVLMSWTRLVKGGFKYTKV